MLIVMGEAWLLPDYRDLIWVYGGLYSIAGVLWARRLFYRAQSDQWTGGNISFSVRLFSRTQSRSALRPHRPHPVRALLQKEFQLHLITLFGLAKLFLLELIAFAWHKLATNHLPPYAHDFFVSSGMLWLIGPLLIGAASVAEERKLGTMESQLCLPVSSRVQFAIKSCFVLVVGGWLCGALFWLNARNVVAAGMIGPLTASGLYAGETWLAIIFGFPAIAALAVYVSTLTRNILQSLVAGIVTISGACLFMYEVNQFARNLEWTFYGATFWRGELVNYLTFIMLLETIFWLAYQNFRSPCDDQRVWSRNLLGLAAAALVPALLITANQLDGNLEWTFSGFTLLWRGELWNYFAIITLLVTFCWLAYHNFRSSCDDRRVWSRNLLGLAAVVLVSALFTTAIYHRAWEFFEPLEPAHGPARLTGLKPPILISGDSASVAVLLPDGRLWRGLLTIETDAEGRAWGDLKMVASAGGPFVGGSNWVGSVGEPVW